MCMVRAVTKCRLGRATLLAVFVGVTSSSWAALDDATAPGDYEAARVHFERGELQLATHKLKALLSHKPRHMSSRILLGRTYLNLGYARLKNSSVSRCALALTLDCLLSRWGSHFATSENLASYSKP
jgi:hypothetical protein